MISDKVVIKKSDRTSFKTWQDCFVNYNAVQEQDHSVQEMKNESECKCQKCIKCTGCI